MHSLNSVVLIISILCNLYGTKAVLNFEDENFYGWEADRYDWSKHPCRRSCKNNEKPKECHYVFVVEIYSTMSKACYDCPSNITDCYRPHCITADGVQKVIYTANRQLPGPTIEVCKDDIIVVDVRNAMIAESTAIHWHGIPQKGTPYMDGVPFVTQCPIPPGTRFRYRFNASTSGTYFWHSHIGYQRDSGLFGPLIIRSSSDDNVHRNLYDYDDKVMFINDWEHINGDTRFVMSYYAGLYKQTDTILINGLGRLKGRKYRFRSIYTGTTDCTIDISIDNHTLLVIGMDGNDIEPVEVDSIHLWNGERVDFIVNANKAIENYWIRYRGYGICSETPSEKLHQVAILRYKFAVDTDPDAPVGYNIPQPWTGQRILNRYNSVTEDPSSVNIPSLNALASNDESLKRKPDQQFYISYDYYALDSYDFHRRDLYGFNKVPSKYARRSVQLNHITLKLPSFPLLSQNYIIKGDTFCNSTTVANKNCTVNECSCTHVLQVKLNSVVELVIIDEGVTAKKAGNTLYHPMHLHGHFFRVIAMETLTEQISVDHIKELDRQGKIKRKLDCAPIKDTVKVPSNGYTIVRFHANNPGYWLYHCHIDQHTNMGMALIFKVGEHQDFPVKPKYFPVCGNFD